MVSPNFEHSSRKEIEEFLLEADALVSERGQRLTELRKQVLRLLCEQDGPIKAYDLLDLIKGTGIAKPPTVYRALRFLQEAGLVHKIESLNAFVACNHSCHDNTAVFMICTSCGRTAEIHAQATARMLNREVNLTNFSVERAVIETHGICGTCTS